MIQINSDIFIQQSDKIRIFNNVTKYCSKCYKEFEESEAIYLNSTTYEYICSSCACCLTQELESNSECILECDRVEALF